MLSDIRRYLVQKGGMLSLYELAGHFDVDEAVMAGMLSHWLRKGRVVKVHSSCGQACGGCDRNGDEEWYQWVEDKPLPQISVACKEQNA